MIDPCFDNRHLRKNPVSEVANMLRTPTQAVGGYSSTGIDESCPSASLILILASHKRLHRYTALWAVKSSHT